MARKDTTKHHNSQPQPSSSSIPRRGPAALALVLAVVVGPHLQQPSWESWVKLVLLFLAIRITFLDWKHWILQSTRQRIQTCLQTIVLDDVLASIFHPETGLLARCVTACLGNFAMYALPTTAEQRTQLMQCALQGFPTSSTSSSKDHALHQAERILQAPGGLTELLPLSLQSWLLRRDDPSNTRNHQNKSDSYRDHHPATVEKLSPIRSSQTEPVDDINPKITLLSDFNSERDDDDSSSVLSEESLQQPSSPPATTPQTKSHNPSPPTPMAILGAILSEVSSRQIQHVLEGLPPRSLEVTSLTAAALLYAQFRGSPRARDISWTVWHASVSLTGSAVLTGSVLALLVRHSLQSSSSRPSDRSLGVPSFFVAPMQTVVGTVKNVMKSIVQSERARKLQGILAVVVLAYFGQTRRKSIGRSR